MAKECADHSKVHSLENKNEYPFTCECGWHIPIKDVAWIAVQEVTHVICYNCGKEWVE
jgi:predicted SprT family Zn-dependent metalloprotease